MRGAIDTIERVTGHRPPTCPWRAFSEPIVREVLGVSWAIGGDLPGVIGADAPADLVRAIGIYKRARDATDADERRIKKIEDEAKRAAQRAARRG